MTVRPFLFAVILVGLARAQQTTATFYGIITDPTGAVIPGASVSLAHDATGAVVRKVSDTAGEFQFDFLRVGAYTLRIEAAGFKRYESRGIDLAAGQQARQTFVLEVGALSETVKVEGTAPLVNTVSTEQLQAFDSMTVKELPLARRNVGNILRIGTGITDSGEGVRMDGTGKNGSTYSVDGTDASSNPEGRYSSTYGRSNYIDIMSIEASRRYTPSKAYHRPSTGACWAGR